MSAWAGALLSLGQWALNNYANWKHEDYAAQRNYFLSERAADKASQRQAEMYERFYSPSALMRQYNEAGLSPGMMFQGMPGTSGTTGPQGSGGGAAPTYMPLSMMEAAQIDLIKAQTQKTEAETKNVESSTIGQNLQNQFDEYRNMNQEAEAVLTLTWIKDKETGKETSLYEYAKEAGSYKEFIDKVRAVDGGEKFNQAAGTEKGQQVLRSIYENQYRFERDIEVLSQEQTNASFQKSILNALSKEGYQDMNAKAAVKQLEASVETSELTQEQKKAWNDLIRRLPEGTTRDIVIVMGMLLGQYVGKVNINTGK